MRDPVTNDPARHDLDLLRAQVASRLPSPPPDMAHEALEERCRRYLQTLRWPSGVECPRCDESDRILWLDARAKWQCYACRYQFSLTAGTLFHNSHIPLWKWFVAVHLLVDSPHGVSANQLRSVLGGSYKTWWFVSHRIRASLRGHGEALLRSMVSADLERCAVGTAGDPVWDEVAALLPAGALDAAPESVALRVRRLVAGPYHQLSAKHLAAYVDERGWRLTNRGNPQLFRDTVLGLLRGENLSYEQLVHAG
jgi:transposase-like protein